MYKGHRSHRHAAQDSRGQEEPGQQVEDDKGRNQRYECWRPEGGGVIQVYGCSAPWIVWEVESGAT